ncbi:MAG: DUF4397 domain-containing protein [Anaerolineae bacterium]|nr:DUF4397 domain-containing protein [Anaerolineae bacterium]
MTRTNLLRYVLLLCLAVLLIACQPQPTPTPTPSPEPSATPVEPTATPTVPPTLTPSVSGANSLDPAKRANVRALVAVPDAPPVDIVVDGSAFALRLTAGRLTAPQPVTPAEHIVQVNPTGNTGAPALLEEPQAFSEGQSSILAFTGTATEFVTTRIDEDLSPLRPGQARVQIVYLAPDNAAAVPIEVQLGDALTGSLTNTGDQIGPQAVPEAAYEFVAKRGNTTVSQNITLAAHRNYTFLLVWQAEDKLQLIKNITPTLRESKLRIIHASGDLPAYDVYVDGKPAAMGVAFRNATEWLSYAPKSYDVRLYPVGGDPNTAPLLQREITLNPDQAADVIIYNSTDASAGRGADAAADIIVFKETLNPTAPGKANLTFVHLARVPDDISVQQGGVTYQNVTPVRFRRMSDTISVEPGKVQLVFLTQNGDQETTIEAPAAFEMEAGFSYLYLITGYQADDQPSILETEVGSEASPVVAATALPPSTMRIRLLNALEVDQALDLYLGDALLASNVTAGSASLYAPVTTEARNLRLVKAGTTELLTQLDLVYQQNRLVTFLAYGKAESVILRDMVDVVAPTTTDAVMRFINVDPDATIVTVFQSPNAVTFVTPTLTELFQGIRYGATSEAKSIPDGLYDLLFSNAENRAEIASLKSVELKPKIRYDVVLLPPDAGTDAARVIIISSEQ